MAEINLKEYTSRAKELEAAIFTQRRLMQQHDELLKTQYPTAPVMKKVKKPTKPNPKDYHIDKPDSPIWISIAMMYVIGVSSLIMLFAVSFWWIFGVLIGVGAIAMTKDEIQNTELPTIFSPLNHPISVNYMVRHLETQTMITRALYQRLRMGKKK